MSPDLHARAMSRLRQRLFARFVAEDLRVVESSELVLLPAEDSPFGGLCYALDTPGSAARLEVAHRRADEFEIYVRTQDARTSLWREQMSFRTTAYFLSRDVKSAIDSLFGIERD